MCKKYALSDTDRMPESKSTKPTRNNSKSANNGIIPNGECEVSDGDEEYEVSSILDICYGDPEGTGKRGLKFKVFQYYWLMCTSIIIYGITSSSWKENFVAIHVASLYIVTAKKN